MTCSKLCWVPVSGTVMVGPNGNESAVLPAASCIGWNPAALARCQVFLVLGRQRSSTSSAPQSARTGIPVSR